MRGFTPYPLQGYWGKKFGLFVFLVFLIPYICFHISDEITLFQTLNNEQHIQLFYWVCLFGLFMMMNSKEKVEDERVKIIRAKSIHIAYMITLVPSFGIALISTVFEQDYSLLGQAAEMYITMGLIVYQLYFHYSLLRDPAWNYNDGGPLDNFRFSRKSFLPLVILSILLVLYSIFL